MSGPQPLGAPGVGPLRGGYAKLYAEHKAESEARRARVLKYPDLARRLTEPPVNLSTPEAWNGWVPPKTQPEDSCSRCQSDPGTGGCRHPTHTARINDSPRRAALVAIAAEAYEREQAGK